MSQLKTCSGHMFVRECYFGSLFLRKNVHFYYSKLRVAVLRKSPAKNGISARSQHCGMRLLAESVRPFFCLSLSMEELVTHWTAFHEI